MADLSQQLQLQQSINDAIATRNDLLEQQNKLLSTQSDLANKITRTVGNEKATRQVRNMTNAIRENNTEISNGVDRAKELEDALGEAADAAEDAGGGFSMLSGAFGMLGKVFSGGLSILKSVGSAILSIGASLAKAAFSVLSFPFKIFGALIDMAQQGGGGGRPIAEAYEEVREVFGDLATGTGKAVSQSFEKIRKGTRKLGETGLSVREVFGRGREGLAALLKDLSEQFAAAGDNISRLRKQFQGMGANLVGFQRGLGISKEEFAELASLSEIRGKSIADSFTEFGNTAIQTAKRFGLDVKDMAKGMKELNLDVENFGHLGPKAFAPITAYARKLGLEIKDMAGVMAKFSGFADTTEAASKLNQAFGLNIDSMKLMSAQNPAEKIDILRKSFFATGKDLSKFNYQQRQYLSSLTGLQGQSLEAAFSLDKQGISYENIAKESEKANKKQLSQKKVLKELSKGIKRLIQTMGGGGKVTGFFDAFMKGFERGIMRSKEMRTVFQKIRKGLRIMKNAGVQVGRAFIKYFPGINRMLKGLGGLLDPKRIGKLAKGMKDAFINMFKRMRYDPKGGVAAFFASVKDLFGDFFSSSSPFIQDIIGGAKTFTKALSMLFAEVIRNVKPMIVSGIKNLVEIIKNPQGFLDAAAAGTSFVGEIFGPIVEAIIENESGDSGVSGALKELFTVVWEKIATPAQEAIKKFFCDLFANVDLMSYLNVLLWGTMARIFAPAIGAFFKKLITAPSPPSGGKGLIEQLGLMMQTLGNMSLPQIAKATVALVALSGGFAAGVYMLGVAAKGIAKLFSDVPAEDVMKGVGVTTAMTLLAVTTAHGAARIAEVNTSGGDIAKAMGTIALAGGLVTAIGIMGSIVAASYSNMPLTSDGVYRAVGVTSSLTVLTIAVAASAALMAPLVPTTAAMAPAAILLAASGLLVVALGRLGSWVARSYKDIEPAVVDSAVKMTATLTGLSIAVAVGAMALGAVMTSSGGLAAGVLLAGLAVLGSIALALSATSKSFIRGFARFSMPTMKKAGIGADVTIKVTKAVVMALDAAMRAGMAKALSWLPGRSDPIEDGLKALNGVFAAFKQYIPGIIKDILEITRTADPAQAERSIKMLNGVMAAIKPMTDAQVAVAKFATAALRVKTPPKIMAAALKQMGDFVAGPARETAALIGKFKDIAADLGQNEKTMKASGIIASMMSSAANFLQAINAPTVAIIKASKSYITRTTVRERGSMLTSTKLESAHLATLDSAKATDTIAKLAAEMGKIIKSISGAMGEMIEDLPHNLPSDDQMEKLTKIGIPAIEVITKMSNGVGNILSLMTSGPFQSITQNISQGKKIDTDTIKNVVTNILAFLIGGEEQHIIRAIDKGEISRITSSTGGFMDVIKVSMAAFAKIGKTYGDKIGDIKAAAKIADLLTTSMGPMVKMLQSIAALTGGIPKIGRDKSGNVSQSDIDKVKELMHRTQEFSKTIIGELVQNAKQFYDTFILEIMPKFDKMKPKEFNKFAGRLKLITGIFSILEPLAATIGGLARMSKGGDKSKDGSVVLDMLQKLTGDDKKSPGAVLADIMGKLADPNTGIGKLINIFTASGGVLSKFKASKEMFKRVELVGQIFEVMGSLGSALGGFKGLKDEDFKAAADAFDNETGYYIKKLIGSNDDKKKTGLIGLADTFFFLPFSAKNFEDVDKKIKGMDAMINSFTGLGPSMDGFDDAVKKLTNGALNNPTTIASLGTVSTNLGKMDGPITALSNLGQRAIKLKLRNKADYLKDTAVATNTAFKEFVQAYKEMALISTDEEKTVTPIFDGLAKMKSGKVVIHHRHEKLKMDVKVHIEARALGRALVSIPLVAGTQKHISGHEGPPFLT